jgi:hypothetical protein
MAQNNPPPPPGFNVITAELNTIGAAFNVIGASFTTIGNSFTTAGNSFNNLAGAIPQALQNLQPIQVQQQVTAIQNQVTRIEARTQNQRITARNASRYAANGDEARLEALVSLATGNPIPNCPATVADIRTLTAPAAARILNALRVAVPGTVAERRKTVEWEFLY